MKILAISGSLRSGSANTALVRSAQAIVCDRAEFNIYNELGALPHFNPELDVDPAPETVSRLRLNIAEADAVFMTTPEYAFGVPGSLKNALDWIVSSGELAGKKTAVVSASPLESGGDKALASLVQTLKVMSAVISEAGTLSVPFIRSKFDSGGHLIDPEATAALTTVLKTLAPEL